MSSRPLRFLLLAIGLWIGARAAILAPGWWPGQGAPNETRPATPASGETATATRANPAAGPLAIVSPVADPALAALRLAPAGRSLIREVPYKGMTADGIAVAVGSTSLAADAIPVSPVAIQSRTANAAAREPGAATAPLVGPGFPSRGRPALLSSRWSASACLLVRRDRGGAALAPGGTLGGSQAGARIAYRLGGGLSAGLRLYAPLRRTQGSELAAGFDWQPVAAIPVQLRAERRQALGREGRSAFALSLHGGASRALPRRVRVDLYGQAGMVGLGARDLFIDGAVRVSVPVGPVEIGAGAWGAAQPGAARLDAGPGISYRLPVQGANVRVEAGWRFRVAGDAAPRSGPALTLAADF